MGIPHLARLNAVYAYGTGKTGCYSDGEVKVRNGGKSGIPRFWFGGVGFVTLSMEVSTAQTLLAAIFVCFD
jgi:hypothetical protein